MSSVDELVALNPFPGLRPFATSEADRFFGRRQQVEELIERLHEVSFVAVTGTSGCGKSSLVRAGLLSELARQSGGGRQTVWRDVVIRPGNSPIVNLAQQLSPRLSPGGGTDESRVGPLYGLLRLGGLGLVEAVRRGRIDPSTRVLVVVDQFEEIFRFQRMIDPEEASAFVKLLLNAARDPQSPVSVMITLRSDALGFCADFRDLPETINHGLYLVPKLTREQRTEAIVHPVEWRGFQMAPRLVQRLLNDVSDNFDDLPVMQHVLTRTWNKWAEACQGRRPIDLDDYKAAGTSQRALSDHADEAFNSVALEHVTEKVFRALTERVAEGTDIRRPLDFDRLCEVVGGERGSVERVVERFRRPDTAFLMPPSDMPLAKNPPIDISHESLIRQWERLRGWAQKEATSRAMLLRLVEAARAYDAKQGSLWRTPELEKGLEWRESTKPTPAWVGLYAGGNACQSVERFLDRSADDARREQRRWKLLVNVVRGLLVAIVAISVAAAVAGFTLRKRTMSRELTNHALVEIDREPAHSAHIALAAMDQDPKNRRAYYALRQALTNLAVAYTEKILPHSEPVLDARYSRDGTRLVTASGKALAIFDSKTFEPIGKPIEAPEPVERVWLIANHTKLVMQTYDTQGNRHTHVQEVGETAARQLSCTGEGNATMITSVSPDEKRIAVGCSDGDIRVWDVTDPEAPPQEFGKVPGASPITALAISAEGDYLASGNLVGAVDVWKSGHTDPWIGRRVLAAPHLQHFTAAIRDIEFHPEDPTLLIAAADDRQAIVWRLDLERRRLDSKAKHQWVLKHERPVTAAKFAVRSDEPAFLFTVSDKTVRLWVSETADVKQVRGHDDWVTDANVSADGELIVTASNDGTAGIWSTRSGSPLAILRGHRDSVSRAVASPAGNHVATASFDRTVRIWRVRPPQLVVSSPHWVLSTAFEPHGTRIAVGEEGRAAILDLKDSANQIPRPLRPNEPPSCGQFQISRISWSPNRTFVLGVLSCYGIADRSQPVLWDARSRKDITPEWLKESRAATFGPGTDDLLTIDQQGRVNITDRAESTVATTGSRRPTGATFGEGYWTAGMSADGKWIAAVKGNDAALWKREELKAQPRILQGHTGAIRTVQFSDDSRWLVTASSDRTARVWSVNSPGEQKVLSGGHTAALLWASFDRSGQRVITGSADSTIRVWDTDAAEELATLRWHGEGVNEVRFSPDGTSILSASDDGTVKFGRCDACNLTVNDLREQVKKLATLSQDEEEDLRRDIDESTRFRLPAFLSWHR